VDGQLIQSMKAQNRGVYWLTSYFSLYVLSGLKHWSNFQEFFWFNVPKLLYGTSFCYAI
jgi:hypothetical protein